MYPCTVPRICTIASSLVSGTFQESLCEYYEEICLTNFCLNIKFLYCSVNCPFSAKSEQQKLKT